MKDLKYLENTGINISMDNKIENFKGSVAVMVGDNLVRKPLRTIESHDQCASEALTTHKMVRGIKANSPLNDLQYYHVCTPGLSPSIAHDVFEGTAPYDLWLAIKNFLKKK